MTDEKESAPVDIEVKVNPVNNQRPLVLKNIGIKVWKGGIGLITSDNLSMFTQIPTIYNNMFYTCCIAYMYYFSGRRQRHRCFQFNFCSFII